MFCKNCGEQLPDNAHFCKKCGTHQLRIIQFAKSLCPAAHLPYLPKSFSLSCLSSFSSSAPSKSTTENLPHSLELSQPQKNSSSKNKYLSPPKSRNQRPGHQPNRHHQLKLVLSIPTSFCPIGRGLFSFSRHLCFILSYILKLFPFPVILMN